MKDSYIGITGFKTGSETYDLVNYFFDNQASQTSRPRLMVGVLASKKRLADLSIGSTRGPALRELPEVVTKAPWHNLYFKEDLYFPAIHYYARPNEPFEQEVETLFKMESIYLRRICRAVQLNIAWPNITEIESLKTKLPKLEVILQIPDDAMSGMTNGQVAEKAGSYAGLADYCLIDASGGKGVPLELEKSIDLMTAVSKKLPDTRMVIAGGLNASALDEKIPIIQAAFKEGFSFDAEGLLRTSDNKSLDYEKCKAYLETAIRLSRK